MRALSMATTVAQGARVQGDRWKQIGYVIGDLFLVTANALLVFSLRSEPWRAELLRPDRIAGPTEPTYESFMANYLAFLVLYGILVVLCCQGQELYRVRESRSNADIALAVAKAVTLATVLLTVFIFLSGVKTISRVVVGVTAILTMLTLVAWRWWRRRQVAKRVAQGYGLRNVLIVGAGEVGQQLRGYLESNQHLGYIVKGFLDGSPNAQSGVLGSYEELPSIARAKFADEIFVTTPEREVVKKVAVEARLNRLEVKVVPDLYDGLAWRAPIEHLGDFPVMALHREPIPVLGFLIKRLIDFTASLAGLIALSPMLAALAVAIKLDSPGPVFYSSWRMGRKGHRFRCYKFRTMAADADARKDALRHLNERQGPFFKITDDPRLTRTGRFLRKYSLDELPQLFNVLKGEMSLVGPRPHPLDDYEQYTLEHLRRLDVMPGITGLWQVSARTDPSFEKNIALDLEYIENWSPWLDMEILLKTVPAVFKGSGA